MKNLRINKRLAASLVSFTMLTTSLVGCENTTNEEMSSFNYATLEDGTIECSGRIDYNLLKKYEVLELTIFDKKEIYIVKKYESFGEFGAYCSYTNITNELEIYENTNDNENKKIQSLGMVEDYLLYYDMVKECYSVEDIENLLTKIKEDKVLEKDKTLTKNK